MIRRNLTPSLLEALSDTPVVLLHSARQTGKSTLAQGLARTTDGGGGEGGSEGGEGPMDSLAAGAVGTS